MALPAFKAGRSWGVPASQDKLQKGAPTLLRREKILRLARRGA